MHLIDAVKMIQAADIKNTPSAWADLGCGSGTFTHALASLLPAQSTIFAVDQSPQQLQVSSSEKVSVSFHQADFIKDKLPFASLDGIMMANALHYVKNKQVLLQQLLTYLSPYGTFIIIEYDTTSSNPWVPYPIPFVQLQALFFATGFRINKKLGERPSIYGRSNMYACQLSRP